MSDPVISVIVPCFNQAKFLPEALETLISQTYTSWECIIIDDGSEDNTSDVAESFTQRDERFRFTRIQNRGASGSRNAGLDFVTGDYVQFLDADDSIHPKKFECQIRQLRGRNQDQLALSYCDYFISDEDDLKKLKPYRISPKLRGNPLHDLILRWETTLSIPIHTFLFDARFFTQYAIRLDESLRNHVDWDCWIKVFRLNPQVHYLDQRLAIYRIHRKSMIRHTKRGDLGEGFLKAIRRNVDSAPQESIEHKLLRKKYDLTRQVYKKYAGIPLLRVYFQASALLQSLFDSFAEIFKREKIGF